MAMLPNPLPRLADDPAGTALGLRLPRGVLVDVTEDGPWHEPLLWYADGPAAAGTWSSLLPARAVGLHPVLIEVDGKGPEGPAEWELLPGEMSYPGDHDAEEVVAGYLSYLTEDDETAGLYDAEQDWSPAQRPGDTGEGGPADEFASAESNDDEGDREWPGLAPAQPLTADPDIRAAEVAAHLVESGDLIGPRAALVHARRSADIPAAIGWCGAYNHESDVARLCAVLRSWEDRFGVRLLALSYDRLTVSVAAPPRTLAEAEAIAVEHYAFSPDTIAQDGNTLRTYAETLITTPAWTFVWD
jgi:hypothetical protein